MSLAVVHTRARFGVRAPEVRVEVFLAGGLPSMAIVGLGSTAVRESRDRIRAALQASQFELPSKRITVNLAPADLPKDGARFDLPIAIGLLAAAGQVPLQALRDVELLGELSLSGALRDISGALPAAMAAHASGRQVIVPEGNAGEAACASNATVFSARTLAQVVAHLRGEARLPRAAAQREAPDTKTPLDLADVVGQAQAKRALEIAAAGAHALRFIGPPGCGKTLLASRLPGLLPPLQDSEAMELAVIRSVSGRREGAAWPTERPFRSPMHGSSAVALVGGGVPPRPGELSLAHHGVLFLDELPEWGRASLEALREPLESGVVHLARSTVQAEFPARALLVTAMNPCPCGWAGDSSGRCACPSETIARYQSRVSGPLLDRIDLHVGLQRVPAADMARKASSEGSAEVRARVLAARERQISRQGVPNAHLEPAQLSSFVQASPEALALLERAGERLALSARAMHRVLRVARTLADLDARASVSDRDIGEALAFRDTSPTPANAWARANLPPGGSTRDTPEHGVVGTH
jgi:magnesium chelatase family protein